MSSRTPTPILREEEVFSFSAIESYGAITRGVTFGNRQNLFVNSSLNLQMDGMLTEDLNVSAVITDQNIPYQPEGNTQQIRDFDNVFIKLYNDDFEVIAGDLVLQNPVPNSYFLNYYKNVQGLSLKYNYHLKGNWQARSQVTGSIAKGQFASVVIDPIEGVQGPYKLRGPNGERFIIILANSEKVYIDGRLLQRGFDRDYVIDYNLGEVTFGSQVMVTRFSRIRIDYEYADQYYTRSNLNATQEIWNDKARFYVNYYREKDNASSTLGFSPSVSDLEALRTGGSQNGLAQISGVDSVGYRENAILYTRKDTIDDQGQARVILAYSADPDEATLQVSFSEVGSGNGDYVLTNTNANGRIYSWVSPQNGQSKGNYAPVQQIPTPNQKQLMVLGSEVKLSEYESFFQELAISSFDQNLYASTGKGDNQGLAWRGGIKAEGRPLTFLPGYTLGGGLDYEYDHENFKAIDRFRSVDFDRDWSYDVFSDTISRQDQILRGSLHIRKNQRNGFYYNAFHRKRSEVIAGTQQQLRFNQEIGPFAVQSDNFYLVNEPGDTKATWLRLNETIRFTPLLFQPGYTYSLDQHQRVVTATDSVANTLMNFVAHDFFLETSDSLTTNFRVDYIRRTDQLPVVGELTDYTKAEEFRMSFGGRYGSQRIRMALNFRKVDELIGEQNTERNLLGKVDYSGNLFNDLIQNTVTISSANTRELKREFVFAQVATGQGTHTWRDENEDDVQDLSEFYEAVNPDEKNYIKLFTPTDEYLNAFQTTFIQSFNASFPTNWISRGTFLKQLSKLSFSRNIRYNYKTTDQDIGYRLIPFGKDITNENILFFRSLNRNTLFYNRNAPGFGMDVNQVSQKNKSLLNKGFEINEKEDWSTTIRLAIGTGFTIRSALGIGSTYNSSDFLENRNFNLNRNTGSLEFIWQPLTNFRLITGVERRAKATVKSEQSGASDINEYRLELTWIRTGQGNLNMGFNWLNIGFDGEQNTLLGYELLEALQPGNNQRWRINWQQSLGKGLQLSLQYDGRKSSNTKMIHTGNVQVTAYF